MKPETKKLLKQIGDTIIAIITALLAALSTTSCYNFLNS